MYFGGRLVVVPWPGMSAPFGADVVELLKRRVTSVANVPGPVQLMVFSKSGFTDSAVREASRTGNVRLVVLDELFAF